MLIGGKFFFSEFLFFPQNFLSTARLIGHEKIANMIEAELLAPSEVPEPPNRVFAPPIFKGKKKCVYVV